MKDIKTSFPIDIVYLWANGADEKFNTIKNKYIKDLNKDTNKYIDDIQEQIFRDNNELKYSLRSIEQNAPWINHIFIVTMFNQIPDWLNTNNTKITIIPQESILPPDTGPIFNSCAVESCLCNIPNLSEYFLLANDDMFFNTYVGSDYFFTDDGRAKFRYVYRRNGCVPRNKKSIYQLLLINSAAEIKKVFGVDVYNYKSSHGIDPHIKSSMIECCEHPELSKIINVTKYHKFRDETDVHHLIFNLYDFVKGRAEIIKSHSKHVGHNLVLDFLYNSLHKKSIKESVFYCTDAIESKVLSCDAPIVCVNDSVYNNDITREHNKSFFNKKFPNKSEFEK